MTCIPWLYNISTKIAYPLALYFSVQHDYTILKTFLKGFVQLNINIMKMKWQRVTFLKLHNARSIWCFSVLYWFYELRLWVIGSWDWLSKYFPSTIVCLFACLFTLISPFLPCLPGDNKLGTSYRSRLGLQGEKWEKHTFTPQGLTNFLSNQSYYSVQSHFEW